MTFEGGFRETRRGGGFGSGSGSGEVSEAGGAGVILRELDAELVKFRGCVDSVGTQFDDSNNRREMKRLRSVIKAKVTEAQTTLKNCKKNKDPTNRILVDRQFNQLDTQIGTFQGLLDNEKSALKANPTPAISDVEGQTNGGFQEDAGYHNQGMQGQSQLQRVGQLEEREEQARELVELQNDIEGLNEIHKEMANLVDQQGEDVDRIDKNVSMAQTRTEHGNQELKQAVHTVKKNRKLKIIIGSIVGGIVLALLILIIVLLAVFVPQNN